MKRSIALLLFLASALFAQRGTFTASQKTALTAASEAVTVQLPSDTAVTAVFDSASVYCSVECEITVERDGTSATTTAISTTATKDGYTGTATAYRSSNVGTSTVMARHVVTAGSTLTIDLREVSVKAGKNLTIRTASITGNAIINILWKEY